MDSNRTQPAGTRRRDALALIVGLPLAAFAAPAVAQGEACVKDEDLTPSEMSLRKSVNFVSVSPDPKKACGGCVFFKGGADPCGQCAILSSTVSAKSVCGSWAAKG